MRATLGVDQWSIGDITVTRILEMQSPMPSEMLLDGVASTELTDYSDLIASGHITPDGWLVAAIQGFVIDDGEQRILVDGGIGNAKDRPNPFFHRLDNPIGGRLCAAGIPPESIDTVLITHIHPDHVGWCTTWDGSRWIPSFPTARHAVVAAEVEYWRTHLHVERDGDYLADSLLPLYAANLITPIGPPARITDHVTVKPSPGHTPHHIHVEIHNGHEQAVITGDVLHHPVQAARPGWASVFDEDPPLARQTRLQFLRTYADTDVSILGTHFAGPVGGRLTTTSDGYRFVPWTPRSKS